MRYGRFSFGLDRCTYILPNYSRTNPACPPRCGGTGALRFLCDSNYTLTSGNVDYLPLAAILSGYGYISGTVYNCAGIPGVLMTTNTSNSTTTDASGFYYLFVPAGAYILTATREPVFYPNSSVIVTAISGTTMGEDIELIKKPTETINGTVTMFEIRGVG